MTSFAIDFVLKNLRSLSKWTLQKGVDALARKASDLVEDEARKKAIVALEQSDYEILQQAVEVLRSDAERLASMITKQAKAVLTASYSHAERGLIIILQMTSGNEGNNVLDFSLANHSTLKPARKEFDHACSKATDAYSNENLSLRDRTFALKIILFSVKMLHENWEPLWEHEILKYLKMAEVKKAMKRRSGEDYEMIVDFATVLRIVLIDTKSCSNAVAEMFELRMATSEFLKVNKQKFRTLNHTAIVDQKEKSTLLHLAVREGNIEVVRELLAVAAGVDLDTKDNYGRTALHWAAWNGKLDCALALIEAGADLNARENEGLTALHLAAWNGNLDCMKALIEAGADLNAQSSIGSTALHLVVDMEKLGCVSALIDAGADLNAQNIYSLTALHLAANNGKLGCVSTLLAAGADLNAKENDGLTALHLAAWNGKFDCVKALNKAGADLNAKENDGLTALHRAAWNGKIDCVAALIEAGADQNAKDKEGRTALDWARERNRTDCIQYLRRVTN